MAIEIEKVYGVICDLVFGSQIQEAVTSAGLSYKSLRSAKDVEEKLAGLDAVKLDAVKLDAVETTIWIINLAAKTSSEPNIVETVLPMILSHSSLSSSSSATPGARIICYAPHVEEARMEWANELLGNNQNIHFVVPRGALLKTLAEVLSAS